MIKLEYDKDIEGKCQHQNKINMGDDVFILCKLREPFTVRCQIFLCVSIKPYNSEIS